MIRNKRSASSRNDGERTAFFWEKYMAKGINWSKEDLAYLKKYYERSSDVQRMADKLGRSVSALQQKAWSLGLSRDRDSMIWPPKKVNMLKKLYPNHTNEYIAKKLDTTLGAINAKAYELKLRKDPEWHMKQSSKGWFKKGHTPFNKGKEWSEFMTKEGQEASRSTTFKPGSIPPNHKTVGYERKSKDGYWEVKVAEPRTFKPKHRLLWEQHHGPIPKGVNIVFIDGNTDNIIIENLRAETIREKFNRCCSIHTTLPPEVRELVQLKGALSRQLNKVNGEKPKRRRARREKDK